MKRVYRVKRLAKVEEKQVVKRIFWLTLLSVILIGTIFTVGINFLGNLADFLDRILGKKNSDTSSSESLRAPTIDNLPKVTRDEKITVTGFSSGGSKIEIFLDGERIGEATLDNSNFMFKDFNLYEGENLISAKSVDDSGNTSDLSSKITIVLDTKEPQLEIASPVNDQNFSGNNKIQVTGKTEKDAQVFANGFLANVDSDGNFEVTIFLSEGENKIEVKAQDEAGNEKVEEVKVNFKK